MKPAALVRLLFALLVFAAAFAAQADEVAFIELRNRPAEELIPVVEPLLDADGSITGTGFQLIVRTSTANLAQIRQAVARLDTAPRQLLVSVFQGDEYGLREASSRLSIDYRGDDLHGRIGSPAQSRGATASVRSGDLTVAGSVHGTRTDVSDNPVQQLRIQEGSDGYIETGSALPFAAARVWRRPGPDIVETGVDYKDVVTGFNVRPRIAGDQVILEINPYKNRLSHFWGNVVDTRSAATVVRGPLGQWLEIGGAATETRRNRSAPGAHYETRETGVSRLWIRADIVN